MSSHPPPSEHSTSQFPQSEPPKDSPLRLYLWIYTDPCKSTVTLFRALLITLCLQETVWAVFPAPLTFQLSLASFLKQVAAYSHQPRSAVRSFLLPGEASQGGGRGTAEP
jgi:hypothetical protein